MYLFLDVDGVLNLFPARSNHDWSDARFKTPYRTFEINYSPEIGERLKKLPVDIIWLTTWLDLANDHIGPLFDMPNYPVIGHDEYRIHAESYIWWWKLPVVQKFIKENPQPFIWLDDDIKTSSAAQIWLEELEIPNLWISPDAGLLHSELDRIEDWISKQ